MAAYSKDFIESAPDVQNRELAIKDPIIEFFVCLLPSFAFVLLAARRFYKIRYYGHTHDQPDLYPLKVIRFLAYSMVLTYGIVWVTCYLDISALNLSRKNINLAVLNFFPMLAWYWSFELTIAELKRKLAPSQINQFLFWNLSIVFSFFKLFQEPKWHDFILLIDGSQLVLSIMITIYFHKKEPEIFDFVDNLDEKANLDQHLMETYRPLSIWVNTNNDGIEDVETNKERLPKIEAHISKKIQKRMLSENTFDKYFEIKVSIQKKPRPKINRSLTDFINLAKELKLIYTLSKFRVLSATPPKLDVEYLQLLSAEEDMINVLNMIGTLQEFLNNLCADPIFMHEVVLDFLGVPNPYKMEFTKFINYAQLINSRISSVQNRASPSSHHGSFELKDISLYQSSRLSTGSLDNKRLQTLYFEAHKVRYEFVKAKRTILYLFEITMIKENNAPVTWTIERSYRSFKLLYQKMKSELKMDVPDIQEFVPSALMGLGESTMVYNQKVLDGLERYLKTILAIKKLFYSIVDEEEQVS